MVDRFQSFLERELPDGVFRGKGILWMTESDARLVFHLVGKRFRVGEVVLEGLRLCEPCEHLGSLTRPGVREALLHRGGLRAQVLEGGLIKVGDPISPI